VSLAFSPTVLADPRLLLLSEAWEETIASMPR
jgi:hypothetical protein